MPDMDEHPTLDERSDELDRKLIAIPEAQVFTKRRVVGAFTAVVTLMLAILGIQLTYVAETRDVVSNRVPRLEQLLDDLRAERDAQDEVIVQLTDALVLYGTILEDNGIDAPPVTIRPTEDE